MAENARSETRILMMKGGVVKEIDVKSLPRSIVESLETAYDKTKVVGISRDTYVGMTEILARMLSEYREELETTDCEMFNHAVAFANGMGINSQDSKYLFETFCWIDRNIAEHGDVFTSKSVNSREIRAYLTSMYGHCTYSEMYRDFKAWARELFSSCDIRVGFVKLAKFYYSVATNKDLQPISVA